MKKIILPTLFLGFSMLLSSCGTGEEPAFGVGGDTPTSVTGIVSQRNFFVQFLKPTLDFYDPTEGVFTEQTTEIIANAKDRSGGAVANATVHIRVNWGYVSSSTCVTDSSGKCSVTYTTGNSSNVPIDYTYPVVTIPTVPATYTTDNFRATVVIYTTGEEAFTDDNSNGVFNDGEIFLDQTEPYFERGTSDATWNIADLDNVSISGNVFDADAIDSPTLLRPHIDDITGIDRVINGTGSHLDVTTTDTADLGDGLYNGASCTHATLCSATTSTVIWDSSYIDLTKD